jgi:DNA-binding NarL/FixJ family response regulator
MARRATSESTARPTPTLLVAGSPAPHDVGRAAAGLGYRVVGIATTAAAALDAAARDRPDLALLDIRLAGATDGVDLASDLRDRLGVPVVFITAQGDHALIARLRASRPFGFVLKPFSDGQLHGAVEVALQQAAADQALRREHAAALARLRELEQRLAPLEARLREVAGLVSETGADAAPADPDLEHRLRGLSRREVEIVRLLAEGCRVAAISRDLDLSVHTVRNHLRAIFRKVKVHSQEALLDAVRALPPGALATRR